MTSGSRVLLVGNFLSDASDGSRAVCEDLALRLGRGGWPVMTTSHKRGRLPRVLDMLATIWRKRDEYSVAQVDVYSGPAFIQAEAACLALRFARRPYILALRGGNLPAFAHRWPLRVRRLLNSAAIVTAPSRYLLEQMRPYGPPLCLLPNPLQLDRYSFQRRQEPRARLVWLRSFHHLYNPTLAPRVLRLLVDDFRDVELVMVGPDKGDGSLAATQEVAEKLGVASRLTYGGAVSKSEVPGWLNRGDVLLNTTNVDNTPVSVLEAMACGLCVISTNVGGIPYLLTHEHNALLVPPEAPDAMAAAVRRVLKEPGLATRLSCNARREVEQFDWRVILPQWEHLLHSIQRSKI